MKKSQTEIFGLAMVVILVAIAILFVVGHIALKPQKPIVREFERSEQVTNIVNSILRTTSKNCSELDVTQLLQDCYWGPSVFCDNGNSSCAYANNTIFYILNATLIAWHNQSFEFVVCKWSAETNCGKVFTNITNGDCSKFVERKFGKAGIPLAPGTLLARLDICG